MKGPSSGRQGPGPADRALLLIDVQNDFMPGGSLAVPQGEQVVPVVNQLAAAYEAAGLTVIASRDFHPAETLHFKDFGGKWPTHCVMGTRGARFHPDVRFPARTILVSKGMNPSSDAYSAFDGVTEDGHPLEEVLRARGIKSLALAGLATDYCVKWTAEEALRKGFSVALVVDAVRGVNVQPGDADRALEGLVVAGAQLTTSEDVLRELG